MSFKTICSCKWLTALRALIWHLSSMDHHVWVKIAWLRKCLITNITLVRFIPWVNAHVRPKITCIWTSLITVTTFIRLLPSMVLHVSRKIILLWKFSISLFLCMFQHVRIKSSWSWKCLITFSALIWLILRVDRHVLHTIVCWKNRLSQTTRYTNSRMHCHINCSLLVYTSLIASILDLSWTVNQSLCMLQIVTIFQYGSRINCPVNSLLKVSHRDSWYGSEYRKMHLWSLAEIIITCSSSAFSGCLAL